MATAPVMHVAVCSRVTPVMCACSSGSSNVNISISSISFDCGPPAAASAQGRCTSGLTASSGPPLHPAAAFRFQWKSKRTSEAQHQLDSLDDRRGHEDRWRLNAYGDIPNQAESVTAASATLPQPEYRSTPDIEYLQELLAMQQSGPKSIGFFGTRNMGFMHQQLIEILSYAMVITKNHIYTSGASGTNAAVIRGALRAERPDLLTVILPQSLRRQPPESQELLAKVQNVVEKPQNDTLPLFEASRLCNMDILAHVQQVICFAFHDSNLLMETCREAKNLRKIVTLFYLD